MNDKKNLQKVVNDYVEQLILPSDPLAPLWNRESILFRKQPKWNYIDCLVIRALLMLYDVNGDSRLLDYAQRFTDEYVSADGTIPTFRAEDHSLDNFCGGRNLLKLWKLTSDEKYLFAAEKLFTELSRNQPRNIYGSFWHKAIYPQQVWLDGAYMALPFMAEYSKLTGDTAVMEDVYAQLENIRSKMLDRDTGLYYHGWDASGASGWADPETGLSHEFWLRSMGWLCAGLADICETDGGRAGNMLKDLLDALNGYAADDGMLMQLPMRRELQVNYPETSGTLLFAYAAIKSARLGISGDDIKSAGNKALDAVAENYISYKGNIPVLKNICLMAGLGGEPYRDGSAEYYLSEQKVENDAKGIAPFLMAYAESIK